MTGTRSALAGAFQGGVEEGQELGFISLLPKDFLKGEIVQDVQPIHVCPYLRIGVYRLIIILFWFPQRDAETRPNYAKKS
jgi:hypothetical protein